ncbi:Zn-ribbon-containing protein [Lonepinella sp. MS14437]|uniref:Zn-ribbon-containing protein n=1 Tax=unclassified Lonepinella TaxID=2642006 RepID=UPI0036DD3888
MYLIDIFLQNKQPERYQQQFILLAELIDEWRYNGQILGREIPVFKAEQEDQFGFGIKVICPEQHSLLPEHNNSEVNRCLENLEKCGVFLQSFQIVADDLMSDQTNQNDPTWQVLYTTYLRSSSPVVNGDNLAPIPLYKIAQNQPHLSLDLIKWLEDWQACDQLQMNGSVLEKSALLEISDINSHLTKHGRALCQEIEQATNVPTYYYLYRIGGDNLSAEQQRRCPCCGGEWRLNTPIADVFYFKCDHCRLVSNLSWNFL